MKKPSALSSPSSQIPRVLTASVAVLLASLAGADAQILIGGSTTYTENFDLLGTATQPWNDGTTVPGFFAGINANGTPDGDLQATDGSGAALTGLLNLGAAGSTDRALGSKATSTNAFANIAYGVLFQNTSASALDITNITYTGELWRTNSVITNREVWATFIKTSDTLFTDTEPGGSAAAANVGSFTALPALNWTAPVQTGNPAEARDGNLPANRLTLSADPNTVVAPGAYFMFRWVDTNIGGTDGYQGIDDFSITFNTLPTPGVDLFYDIAHTVGGAPNGVLAVSSAPYWDLGAVGGPPAGFNNNDRINFTTPTTATISVPADVNPFSTTVSADSGTYTIGGAGKVGGTLLKQNAGTLALTSANNFADASTVSGPVSGVTLAGGTIITSADDALGNGSMVVSGVGGTLEVTGATTVSARGILGDGTLTKAGTGTLVVTGPSSNTGDLIFTGGGLRLDTTGGGTVTSRISGNVDIVVTSSGTTGVAGIGGAPAGGLVDPDTLPNDYVGSVTVNSGQLVLRKDAGVTAITGPLIVNTGGSVRYSGNNVGDQISDTSTITINGGSFGDVLPAGGNPTNPGAPETVGAVTLNGGNFSTGRAPFTISSLSGAPATGVLTVTAGNALAARGGTLTAETVVLTGGSIDLDGGSTTAGNESRLNIGAGGLTITNANINLNAVISTGSATSVGSIVTIGGPVSSTGTSNILDVRAAAMTGAGATVDLNFGTQQIAVQGDLNIGTGLAPVRVQNGGITKLGGGTLHLSGDTTLFELNINAGTVVLEEEATAPVVPGAAAAGEFAAFSDASGAGSPQAVPEPGAVALLATGLLGLLGRRRRA